MESYLEPFIQKPKLLFLIDGAGALLSALLLGVVLVRLESIFGIPPNILYVLAALPCIFAVYDLYCYLKVERQLSSFLKGIAIMNLAYCVLSLGLAYGHRETITSFGWGYILVEIVIVGVLAVIELRAAK